MVLEIQGLGTTSDEGLFADRGSLQSSKVVQAITW